MTPSDGSFAGELGLVGLFDVAQLLMLNRATGRLSIASLGKNGYLYFEDGRIINAVDDAQGEGERAAWRVLSWRKGHFEFKPEPAGGQTMIHTNTEALLLDAARRIDEVAADTGAGPETPRLRERQSAM